MRQLTEGTLNFLELYSAICLFLGIATLEDRSIAMAQSQQIAARHGGEMPFRVSKENIINFQGAFPIQVRE